MKNFHSENFFMKISESFEKIFASATAAAHRHDTAKLFLSYLHSWVVNPFLNLPGPQIEQTYWNDFKDLMEEQGRSYTVYCRWMIPLTKQEHSYCMTQDIPGKQVLVKNFNFEKTNSFQTDKFKSAHSVFEVHQKTISACLALSKDNKEL